MRAPRVLRARARSRGLERRVEEISKSLTENWKTTAEMRAAVEARMMKVSLTQESHDRTLEAVIHHLRKVM